MTKRLDRTSQALNTKPLPTSAEQLFKYYADLFLIGKCQKVESVEKEISSTTCLDLKKNMIKNF